MMEFIKKNSMFGIIILVVVITYIGVSVNPRQIDMETTNVVMIDNK